MGFKQIFKDGFGEFKRRSKIKRLKRKLTIREKIFSDELTLLGQKAWESKLDLSEYSCITEHIISSQNDLDSITKRQQELENQRVRIEQKRGSENDNFNSQLNAIEARKKEIDLKLVELNKESREIQKEIDRIQDRLNQIKREKEKLELKISDNQTTDEEKVPIEKKIQSIEEERNNLELKPEKSSKKKDELLESMMPFEDQSSKFQAKIDEIRKEQKTISEKYDQELKKTQREISDCQKEQKKANREKIGYFHKLGKALFSSNFVNKSVNTELSTVRNASSEIKNQEMDIKSLEESGTPESKRALWKLTGLVVLLFVLVAGIVFVVRMISPQENGKERDRIKERQVASLAERGIKSTLNKREFAKDSQEQVINKNVQIDWSDLEISEHTLEGLNQISFKLENLFQEFENSVSNSKKEISSAQRIMSDIGKDSPEKLFGWVRDNTFFIPYQGSLRGSEGVLIDRLGNSLDRAILLHKLLKLAGYNTRLANGRLTSEQSKEIIEKIIPPPDIDSFIDGIPILESTRELIKRCSHEYGIPQDELFKTIKEKKIEKQQTVAKISERVNKLTPQLLDLVRNFQDTDVKKMRRTMLESIQDHWWVQFQKDSNWVDLDPTSPDSLPDERLTQSERYIQPEELNDSLLHRITIRVIIEQWKDKQLKEFVVLSQELQPSKWIGKRIALGHHPAEWPKSINLFKEKKPLSALRKKILDQKIWTPVLVMGSKNVTSLSFSDTGEVRKKALKRKKDVRSILKTFSLSGRAMPGEDLKKDHKGKSQLTAEWIEYEIFSPGKPTRKIRREVFDLIGPGSRFKKEISIPVISLKLQMERNLALMGQTEILPLCCQLSKTFVGNLINGIFLSTKKNLLSILKEKNLKNIDFVIDKMNQLQMKQIQLYRLALERYSKDNIIVTPNILSFHSFLKESHDEFFNLYNALDIVSNEVYPILNNKPENFFQVRLRQGIRDSITELVVMSRYGGKENLAELCREMERNGVIWLAADSSKNISLLESNLPEDIVARMKKQLNQGFVVVAPEKVVFINSKPVVIWWRIDPRTGDTLIIGEKGWGQAMVEYVEEVNIVIQMKDIVGFYSNLMKCVYMSSASFMTGGKANRNLFYRCVLELICSKVNSAVESFLDIEADWTNFILKQTIGYIWGEFCKALFGN